MSDVSRIYLNEAAPVAMWRWETITETIITESTMTSQPADAGRVGVGVGTTFSPSGDARAGGAVCRGGSY